MDVGYSIPRIYAVVDNRQAEHRSSVIEMDGKIFDHVIYILIDARLIIAMLVLTWWISVG